METYVDESDRDRVWQIKGFINQGLINQTPTGDYISDKKLACPLYFSIGVVPPFTDSLKNKEHRGTGVLHKAFHTRTVQQTRIGKTVGRCHL